MSTRATSEDSRTDPQRTDSRVTMDRWRNTYVVAAAPSNRHAGIQDVLQRIDRAVAEELPGSCGRRLRQRFDQAGDAVWRIRELDFSFVVDVSTTAAADIAPAWSEIVAARLAEIIDRGAESDGILRFATRATYLAQFALDLAAGRAWSKWYYEEFRPLRQLPPGRAICEALTREPEQGGRTILHLAESGHLEEILVALTETEAQALYEQCFGAAAISASSTELSRWSGRLLEVWNDEPLRPTGVAPKYFVDALRWLARAAVRFPGAETDSAACAAVIGLLELRGVLASIHSPTVADRLVRDLAQAEVNIEESIEIAQREGALVADRGLRFLASVAKGDPDWAAQAAAVLLRNHQPPPHAALAGESMVTSFGGIFLVGPALVDLDLKQIAETAAGEGEQKQETASFLRYAVLAKCLGSPRAFEAAADPALRLLSGFHRSHLQEKQPSLRPHDLAGAQALLVRNLARLTRCEGRCLLAEVIRLPPHESEILLLRDLAGNEWLHASAPPAMENREEMLVLALDLVRESTGNVPYLLLRQPLEALAESRTLQSRAHRLLAVDQDEDEEQVGHELAEVLALSQCPPASAQQKKLPHLLASSTEEFVYLSFASVWPDFDIVLDIFGALLARAALRGFARRLIGFQSSGPEHLGRNFLEGCSTVRILPERIEVALPRCPLSLVLQISGLTRQTYTVPWLEGREVCLLPPPE